MPHNAGLKVMLSGANGRLGQVLQEEINTMPDVDLVARYDSVAGFDGQPLGEVIIDVSHHTRTPAVLQFAIERACPLVIGTTALSADTLDQVTQAAQVIPILLASNFSLGAVALGQLAQQATRLLREFDIEIIDHHHSNKKDAPSGTALDLESQIRSAGSAPVSIHSKREGDVVGVHEIVLSGPYETLSLRHEVTDRRLFAQGALAAALFLAVQPAGRYTMEDLLKTG